MINVTNDFKLAQRQPVKEIFAFLTDGTDQITESNDLQSLKINVIGGLVKSSMKTAEAVFLGEHDYLDKIVQIGVGTRLAGGTVEYVNYGSFKVTKKEENNEDRKTTILMSDLLIKTNTPYDFSPLTGFPMTVGECLTAICTKFGFTLQSSVFPNSDYIISTDLFLSNKKSYRGIIDQIAEIAGAVILFNDSDNLEVRVISKVATVDSLDANSLISLAVEKEFGPINSIVLSRQPQEDNIVKNF